MQKTWVRYRRKIKKQEQMNFNFIRYFFEKQFADFYAKSHISRVSWVKAIEEHR